MILIIGDPDKRFQEDALRILRAIRFACKLDFNIDSKTKESIFKNKELLKNISIERINSELFEIFKYKNIEEFKTLIYLAFKLGVFNHSLFNKQLVIGNNEFKNFHMETCKYTPKPGSPKRIIFIDTADAIKSGYKACPNCIPKGDIT